MTDEELKKERYVCQIQSGTEGLMIADLFIKTAVAHIVKPVTLKKEEYLPTDLVDFGDLKKSRLSGSLSRCIKRGWISVENPAGEIVKEERPAPEMKKPTPSAGISEVRAGLVDPKECTDIAGEAAQPKGIDPFPKDKEIPIKEVISLVEARTPNTFAVTEGDLKNPVAKVANYTEFMKLRYFQKLKTIKATVNTDLLKDVIVKDTYPQLVHNSKIRLAELHNGE